MSMPIVIHVAPDLDCITGAWLLQRYGGLAENPVIFVNTGSPDASLLRSARAVVDTGRDYHPESLRFDHHQDPGLPCAAALVYRWIKDKGADVEHLRHLLNVVDAHDRGMPYPDTNHSRAMGLHAIYGAGRPEGDDAGSLAWGYQLLDALDKAARDREEGRRLLDQHTVYRSGDGLLVALRDAPRAATSAAFERGARLVVFADYATNAIGVQRAQEWALPHVGELVETVLHTSDTVGPITHAELERWFRHPAGFFAGRGTAKAPSTEPIVVDVAEVARELDAWYQR